MSEVFKSPNRTGARELNFGERGLEKQAETAEVSENPQVETEPQVQHSRLSSQSPEVRAASSQPNEPKAKQTEPDDWDEVAFRAEVERVKEQAKKQGYEEGLLKAEQEYQAKTQETLRSLGEIVETLPKQIEAELVQVRESAVDVVKACIAKAFGQLLLEQENVIKLVEQVIYQVDPEGDSKIHVNPKDYQMLSADEEWIKSYKERGISFVSDQKVGLGGCVIETTAGTFDGRIETQLQHLFQCVDD